MTRLSRLAAWARALHADEKGNSFAVFIVLLPLILGAFGTGIDIARNTYIRTTLQNSLDVAAVSGAAAATPDGTGKINLTTAANQTRVLATIEKLYAMDRDAGPGIDCTGPQSPISGAPSGTVRCWKTVKVTFKTSSVEITITEQSHNAFLQILGIPVQKYTLTSSGFVGQSGR